MRFGRGSFWARRGAMRRGAVVTTIVCLLQALVHGPTVGQRSCDSIERHGRSAALIDLTAADAALMNAPRDGAEHVTRSPLGDGALIPISRRLNRHVVIGAITTHPRSSSTARRHRVSLSRAPPLFA